MFSNNGNLNKIILGEHSVFHGDDGYSCGIPMEDWMNSNQVINSTDLMGDNVHPGTWTIHDNE